MVDSLIQDYWKENEKKKLVNFALSFIFFIENIKRFFKVFLIIIFNFNIFTFEESRTFLQSSNISSNHFYNDQLIPLLLRQSVLFLTQP